MEIQPLCRYHFRPTKTPESNFFIVDLLPDHASTYDSYCLKYVGAAFEGGENWFQSWIDQLAQEPYHGSFEEVKRKLQELIVECFQNDFKCDISYLASYFK